MNVHPPRSYGGNTVLLVKKEAFDKYKESEIWHYSDYEGSSYDYRVTKVDSRFVELDELIDKYSDRIEIPETEKPMIEKKLYSLIVLLRKETRVPGSFSLQPYRDAVLDNFASKLERVVKLIDNLEKRLRRIEDRPIIK